MESVREIVEREIQESGDLNSFLSNFLGWIPDRAYKNGCLNLSFASEEDCVPFSVLGCNEAEGYSAKFARQTPNGFLAEFRSAARHCNIRLPGLRVKLHNRRGESELQEELNRLLLPIYIRMRELGYQHYKDLTC